MAAKVRELREASSAELEQKLRAGRDELFRLRFQQATAQLDNPMRVRQIRKEIAQIKTILRERELAGEG